MADSLHTAGVSLSIQLPAATSGTDSIVYSLSASTDNGTLSNNLPAGLSLNSNSRTLSGAATAAGTYAVAWTATDADGDRVELAFNLVVEVGPHPLLRAVGLHRRPGLAPGRGHRRRAFRPLHPGRRPAVALPAAGGGGRQWQRHPAIQPDRLRVRRQQRRVAERPAQGFWFFFPPAPAGSVAPRRLSAPTA